MKKHNNKKSKKQPQNRKKYTEMQKKLLSVSENLNKAYVTYSSFLTMIDKKYDDQFEELKKKDLMNDEISKMFIEITETIKEYQKKCEDFKFKLRSLTKRIHDTKKDTKLLSIFDSLLELQQDDFISKAMNDDLNESMSQVIKKVEPLLKEEESSELKEEDIKEEKSEKKENTQEEINKNNKEEKSKFIEKEINNFQESLSTIDPFVCKN